MTKPGEIGITRLIHALGYSLKGLRAAVRHEAAFRQELAACVILMPVAFWLGGSPLEYALLLGCLFLVLIVELINSAIEAVVDRAGQEHHELAGRAKDMGSAAVLVSLLNAAVIWSLLLYAKLF